MKKETTYQQRLAERNARIVAEWAEMTRSPEASRMKARRALARKYHRTENHIYKIIRDGIR